MRISVQRSWPLRSMVLFVSIMAGTGLFTLVYWSRNVSTGLAWVRPITKSRAAELRFNYHTCTSQPNRLNKVSKYRSEPYTWRAGKRMLFNRLTDDYCYCPVTIPSYNTPPQVDFTRNPCWWDEEHELQCVPYFYIIGFSKCATTDMFSNLHMHPSIMTSTKEPHWFDYKRFFENNMYLQNYTDQFSKATKKIREQVETQGKSQLVFGDGTPCTAWSSQYWRCFLDNNPSLPEPNHTNADVLHRMVPSAKIIVLTRDPTDRLYSRYLTWKNRLPHPAYEDPSPERFHELCVRAVEVYTKCFQERSPRQCAYDGTLYTQVILRLQEGMYSVFLKDWLRVYPKEQIIFVSFEDYIKSKVDTLSAVWVFLGLEPVRKTQQVKIAAKAPMNKQKKAYDTVGLMLPETRKLLDEFYRPFQEELHTMVRNGAFTLIKDVNTSIDS